MIIDPTEVILKTYPRFDVFRNKENIAMCFFAVLRYSKVLRWLCCQNALFNA